LFLIGVSLVIGFPCSGDPLSCSKKVNATYYALSRPIWTFGVLLVLFGILMGQFSFAKAFLSSSLLRMMARSIPISAVLFVSVV